ncbi:hepatocyte nuclear factor 6-like isoform X1 [Salmo salar]|uniref:Hepatocyte nuclear factor 6-like isoform X1 n=1 Tax=Salmo salar TaxID=8030 RepID=A0A1S3T5J4_SALSA|nr:hepatocyte nuclear factor 6-like isoform X1 [Salmo salar]|eukprot:XP_014071857.1 PREDICTED: hepatocyte nuclear factor 6-like isoform X1 [Salmo salar]
MELTMENIGNLHGVSHSHQTGDLMNSPHHARQSLASHRNLVSHGRSAMVSSMASILEGAGEYRTDHALSGPLHPAMTMSCDSGMTMSSTYTTLTPLQHLPPIATVSDKFHHHPHPHAHHHPAHQRLTAGNVSGSFTLMRDDRSLASMSNLYGHYPKDMSGMGQPLSPLSNGLGSLHNSQQTLGAYGPGAHLSNDKMLSSGGFESHASMLSRSEEHLARGFGGHGAGIMSSLNGMHHHSHPHSQANGSMLSDRERQTAGGGQGGGSGQVEEINTKEVAQRITAELKRYSIPQAIFAQRILCRSQGTLSDLLRNPKPWSKLKSGRETFRRMWKWLQEPEFQRMSALRLAVARPLRERVAPHPISDQPHSSHRSQADRLAERLQAQRAGAAQRLQHGAQKAAAGLHGPAAPHAHRHLQGEQAPVQGDADHHLPAAGPGAQHRQQLLHECPAPLRGPLARRARHQPRPAGHLGHHLLQSLRGQGGATGWDGKVVPPVAHSVPNIHVDASFVPCNHLLVSRNFNYNDLKVSPLDCYEASET